MLRNVTQKAAQATRRFSTTVRTLQQSVQVNTGRLAILPPALSHDKASLNITPQKPKDVSFVTCGDGKISDDGMFAQLKSFIPGLANRGRVVWTRVPAQPTKATRVQSDSTVTGKVVHMDIPSAMNSSILTHKALGTEVTVTAPHYDCAGDPKTPPGKKMAIQVNQLAQMMTGHLKAPHIIVGGVIKNNHQDLELRKAFILNPKNAPLSDLQKGLLQEAKRNIPGFRIKTYPASFTPGTSAKQHKVHSKAKRPVQMPNGQPFSSQYKKSNGGGRSQQSGSSQNNQQSHQSGESQGSKTQWRDYVPVVVGTAGVMTITGGAMNLKGGRELRDSVHSSLKEAGKFHTQFQEFVGDMRAFHTDSRHFHKDMGDLHKQAQKLEPLVASLDKQTKILTAGNEKRQQENAKFADGNKRRQAETAKFEDGNNRRRVVTAQLKTEPKATQIDPASLKPMQLQERKKAQ